MPKKIPRGVILDLLDLYDLEIEVLYIVLEYDTQSYKLNYRFKELKDAMRSLIAKWNIGPESTGSISPDTFYIPFHDHDLITESDARFNASDYESELDWGPQEIMEKMHTTRKLIREVLDSDFVDENETRDEKVKDIIEGTKRDLPNVVAEAKHMLGLRIRENTSRSERITKIEIPELPIIRTVSFNDTLPGIVVDGKDCPLRRMSDQLKVARIMLNGGSSKGNRHHWETIHKKISREALAPPGPGKSVQKERIKTAVVGINSKIRAAFAVDLFTWDGKGYLICNF